MSIKNNIVQSSYQPGLNQLFFQPFQSRKILTSFLHNLIENKLKNFKILIDFEFKTFVFVK